MAQNEPPGALVGIGGWLSLLALGIGAQPFLGLISLAETLRSSRTIPGGW